MSTLHSKSVIARAAFPLVWSRELSFNRAPPRLVPSPRMLLQRRSYWSIFFSFSFSGSFLFWFYTYTDIHISRHAAHSWTISQLLLWLNRPSSSRTDPLFPSYFDSTREKPTISKKNEKKKQKKAKETESGAPLALNATECSLSLCHVDRFKWLSDKISRRLVQMYLWRRTKRGRKKRERKKIGPFNSVHSECGVAITPTCVAHVEYT